MNDRSGDSRADPLVGTRVGRYEILGLVGRGGMGMVYEATAADGTRVALKILREEVAADETARDRFKLEAEIAGRIRNRHLVPVLDCGEHNGLPYMAEPFIDGASLEQILTGRRRLDVRTTVGICADVAEALEALWEAGMVHRDVKPGNVLVDRAGRAYLTDFGLAKDTQGRALTLPGQTLGSPAYMAPEQIRGEGVTCAADIYSLGCVAYECLQGQAPFGDRFGIRKLWAHLNDDPPKPNIDGVSPEFVDALLSALAKQPHDRPASARDYATSLADAAGISLVELTG